MKEQGFKIPDNYFESKKASLKEIAGAEPLNEKPARKLKSWYWLASAALLAIAVFLIPTEELDPQLTYSDLPEEDIIEYLSEDPHGIYPESLIDYTEADSLFDTQAFDDELIESYLNENSIDYL